MTAKPAGPNRLTEVKFTIKVDGQDGGRFWGTLTSPASAEPFIGVLSADGKRLRIVLQRGGIVDGTVVTPDSIEIMYGEKRERRWRRGDQHLDAAEIGKRYAHAAHDDGRHDG